MPSAAARPMLALARGHWRSQRIGGGGLSFGDFSLATQRKVTRPSPKGGRNPVEGPALASCTAPAVPRAKAIYEPLIPNPSPTRGEGSKTLSGTDPSPAMGERGKDYRADDPLSRWERVRVRGLERFQPCIRRHQPLGADVVELDLHPALLADPFEVEHYAFPEFRMEHPSQSRARH